MQLKKTMPNERFLAQKHGGGNRKAAQNHGFRKEIQNELVRHLRARTIVFCSEIVVGTMAFE